MKITHFLPAACAAFAFATANVQAGRGPDAQQHSLAISLTIKSEAGRLTRMGPGGSELITQKISNKELLDFFVEEFPQMGGSIKGWSIALISYNGDVVGTALVKKDATPIDITSYFSAQLNDLVVNSYQSYGSTESGVNNSIAAVGLYLGSFSYESQGAFEGKYIVVDGYEYLTGAKLTGLSGLANDGLFDFGIVTGSATAGPGKPYIFIPV